MADLDTITIRGFKSIASLEKMKLGAINVIIGPNGSGKSNFIGAFALIKTMRAGHLQDRLGHYWNGEPAALWSQGERRGGNSGSGFMGMAKDPQGGASAPGMVSDILPMDEWAEHDGAGETDYAGPEDNGPVWCVGEKLTRNGSEAGLSKDESLGPVARWIARPDQRVDHLPLPRSGQERPNCACPARSTTTVACDRMAATCLLSCIS